MDQNDLRSLLEGCLYSLSQTKRHVDLPDVCQRLGLADIVWEAGASKAQRMAASLTATADQRLESVASALLRSYPPAAPERFNVEEVLWGDSSPDLSTRCRRELAQSLQLSDLWLRDGAFRELLERLWVLDGAPSICGGHGYTLRSEIEQHVFTNDDLSVDTLFECLGAYACTGRRFAIFLEGLAGSSVRPDEPQQRQFVARTNTTLHRFGFELRETGAEGGYPAFTLASQRGVAGRPKNIVFASPIKPDLRIRDAVSNDIEVASNPDDVLIYDRAIDATCGLRWRELQSWWAETTGVSDDAGAKASLYRRLESCLPANSPPQRTFFRSYFAAFKAAVPDLPALLPEVWLHWDPKTVRERGADALLRFRMDFLMLLPNQVRIVIEIDGVHHYADQSGSASPTIYARTVEGDRELKLAGYEVYRFGAAELGGQGGGLVAAFFDQLFRKHGVSYGSSS